MHGDGPKVRERYRYLSIQSALRRYAAMGITLEVDEDGVPVLPQGRARRSRRLATERPDSLSTSMPTQVLHDARELGAFSRQWRERCALSLRQASSHAGVGVRFLSEFERGKSTVEFGKVLIALDALDLELLIRPRR